MSLRLPPIPQALLWAISVLALLVWLGVGWLWWRQKDYLPPTPSTTSSPSLQDQPELFPAQLTTFTSPEYGFSFQYPSDMRVGPYSPPPRYQPISEDSGWVLQDSNDNLLVEITITSLKLEDFQQQFPQLEFSSYEQGQLPGWFALYNNTETFYFLEKAGGAAVFIIGRIEKFEEGPETALPIIEEIVNSIT